MGLKDALKSTPQPYVLPPEIPLKIERKPKKDLRKAEIMLDMVISKIQVLKMNGKVWIIEQLKEIKKELEG